MSSNNSETALNTNHQVSFHEFLVPEKPQEITFRFTQLLPNVWLERAIFSALLLLIALTAVPFGTVDPWWEGIFESIVFMLGACWIYSSIMGKRWNIPTVLVPIVGLILLAYLQTLPLWPADLDRDIRQGAFHALSADPFETKRFVLKLLALCLTLALLLNYTSSRKRLLALAHIVIFVGGASAVFGICRNLLPATELSSLWNARLMVGSFGQFINRNHFALLMEMSLGPAVGLAFYAGRSTKGCLYAATALLVCVALVLANSRGGIITMLAQLGFLSWIYLGEMSPQSSLRHRAYCEELGTLTLRTRTQALAVRGVLILFLLSAALGSVLWLGGEPVRHRLEALPNEFSTQGIDPESRSANRLRIWGATWSLVESHPFLGSGFGAYKTAIAEYFAGSDEWQPQQAHNEYLELAANGGIVAVALGIWFVLILVREVRKRLHEGEALQRVLCFGALVGVLGVAIHSLVDFGLHVTVNALVFCGLISLATATTKFSFEPEKLH